MGSLLIWMRSRTERRCGEVYSPILEGGVCASAEDAYCERIEDIKALVEPLPLVPAMCIGFSLSNSEGYSS